LYVFSNHAALDGDVPSLPEFFPLATNAVEFAFVFFEVHNHGQQPWMARGFFRSFSICQPACDTIHPSSIWSPNSSVTPGFVEVFRCLAHPYDLRPSRVVFTTFILAAICSHDY
jgi:hypothetical protein